MCRISAHKLCSGSGRQAPARHLLTGVQVRACDHVRRQARQTEWRGFAYEFTPCTALTSVIQAGLTHCAQKRIGNGRGKVGRSGFQGRHRLRLACGWRRWCYRQHCTLAGPMKHKARRKQVQAGWVVWQGARRKWCAGQGTRSLVAASMHVLARCLCQAVRSGRVRACDRVRRQARRTGWRWYASGYYSLCISQRGPDHTG